MARWESHESGFRNVCLAAADEEYVSGYTHNYYRYPARFPPAFARAAIEEFSSPGDTILDPFLGGGTTLVEGLALNRRVIGVDLNPIAVFVSSVKATPLSSGQLNLVKQVAEDCLRKPLGIHENAAAAKNDIRFVNTPWWVRGTICSLLRRISSVEDSRIRAFLRCALLKTSQWALDCRTELPNSSALAQAFQSHAQRMCKEMEEFREALRSVSGNGKPLNSFRRRILLRSAIGIEQDPRIPNNWLPIRLVITSPPYPGVHVLYHRWQVRGRRETPAPFGILARPDGHGPSHFTLGGRHEAGLKRYFEMLVACYSSVASLMHPEALLIQLVSVADPNLLLPKLLDVMNRAGFEELKVHQKSYGEGRGVWRTVPHRRWYARDQAHSASGRELLLFHTLKSDTSKA